MFPSKSVQFSGFTFGCVIYLEAIFLHGVTHGSKFNFAHEYLTVPALSVEKTNLSRLNCLFTIEKNSLFILCVGLFLDHFICSIAHFVYLYTDTTLFWLLYFYSKPGNQIVLVLNFVLLFQCYFLELTLRPSAFLYKLENQPVNFYFKSLLGFWLG